MKSIAKKHKKHNPKNTAAHPTSNMLRCKICGYETDAFDFSFHIALAHSGEYTAFLKEQGMEVPR